MRYTDKQIDTRKRQKAINLLEKIMKNLFRMFRDEKTTKEQVAERFFFLKGQLDDLGDPALTGEYHSAMKKYVKDIASVLRSTQELDAMRSPQMSRLNSIQKIKNQTSFRRR